MTERDTKSDEPRGPSQQMPEPKRDEHDAGIRIRGEAPATGRIEDEGLLPGVPPAELDSPPPGSLQGSPVGLGPAMAGLMPVSGDIDRKDVADAEERARHAEEAARKR